MYPNRFARNMVLTTPMSIEAGQLLLLLNWMSPAFPVGAFAYSHGLEWAIVEGHVGDATGLEIWIGDLVTRGSGWNDAVLFARCYEDSAEELNELALALAGSKERYLETTQLGRSFATAAGVFGESPHPTSAPSPMPAPHEKAHVVGPSPVTGLVPGMREGALWAEENPIAYPVAAGSACAAFGIAKHHALLAFVQGFCAAMTSVAVRLVPLGQTAGLRSLRNLMPVIDATASRAASARLDDLGSVTLHSDIAAMQHETQYARVFRT